MKVREVLRILRRDGWTIDRQQGSHRQLVHPTKPATITVAGNMNDDIPIGTLGAIFKAAELERKR